MFLTVYSKPYDSMVHLGQDHSMLIAHLSFSYQWNVIYKIFTVKNKFSCIPRYFTYICSIELEFYQESN